MRIHADIVIIGGGVIGCAIAYHLAKRGAENILVIERSDGPGHGATGKCAGGIRAQFSTRVNVELSQRSIAEFERFEDETQCPMWYKQWGYLFLATTPELMASFEKNIALQQSLGLPSKFVTPDEIKEIAPYVNMDGVLGGTYCPTDGFGDPSDVSNGYAIAARRLGVEIAFSTAVTGIDTSSGSVTAVDTDKGRVTTGCVVNCAGPWAKQIGAMAGREIPIEPIRRQIFVTEAFDGIADPFPMTVDLATTLYFHRESRGILVGMSNHAEAPAYNETFDSAFFEQMIEAAANRAPVLLDAGVAHQWAGLYEVTPDHHPIFGPDPELPGMWICAGFSGHGFMHAPGAGQTMAEWITTGECRSLDLSPLRIERFNDPASLVHEKNVI